MKNNFFHLQLCLPGSHGGAIGTSVGQSFHAPHVTAQTSLMKGNSSVLLQYPPSNQRWQCARSESLQSANASALLNFSNPQQP